MHEQGSMPRLQQAISPLREALATHRVYGSIQTLEDVRTFMEHHVFAVWDFMSLLKALQRLLTCVSLPWLPEGDPLSRRLINEIVLGEETDEDGQGGYLSHFELYLAAMEEAGADASAIMRFMAHIRAGDPAPEALRNAVVPDAAREFVETTWEIVQSHAPHRIAAAFSLGREEIIPAMFVALIAELHQRFPAQLRRFHTYLDRHVHLDQGQHGPMAIRMLTQLCGGDPQKWQEAEMTAVAVLRARLLLWDSIAHQLHAGPETG